MFCGSKCPRLLLILYPLHTCAFVYVRRVLLMSTPSSTRFHTRSMRAGGDAGPDAPSRIYSVAIAFEPQSFFLPCNRECRVSGTMGENKLNTALVCRSASTTSETSAKPTSWRLRTLYV